MREEHVDPVTGVVTPYDILDTPPKQNKPETLFVQSFWPDERTKPETYLTKAITTIRTIT
jgi:hypothetical protein